MRAYWGSGGIAPRILVIILLRNIRILLLRIKINPVTCENISWIHIKNHLHFILPLTEFFVPNRTGLLAVRIASCFPLMLYHCRYHHIIISVPFCNGITRFSALAKTRVTVVCLETFLWCDKFLEWLHHHHHHHHHLRSY